MLPHSNKKSSYPHPGPVKRNNQPHDSESDAHVTCSSNQTMLKMLVYTMQGTRHEHCNNTAISHTMAMTSAVHSPHFHCQRNPAATAGSIQITQEHAASLLCPLPALPLLLGWVANYWCCSKPWLALPDGLQQQGWGTAWVAAVALTIFTEGQQHCVNGHLIDGEEDLQRAHKQQE